MTIENFLYLNTDFFEYFYISPLTGVISRILVLPLQSDDKMFDFVILQNLYFYSIGMVVGPAIGGAVSTHMGEQESFIFCTNLFCCVPRLFEYV